MSVSYMASPQGRRLAYRYTPPRSGRTYVWLSGFKSDMSGTKVTVLEAWAQQQGHGFLAFDYSGHGVSDGAFEDGTISAWREDALAAIE
ncbi:MAG: alpha/beta hydrolase, partial [Alphaproteobacteria bacterium]|nr:alpha/beta hydrolase [Alphaproteobacteria bacterium]